ncbi:response regulator transcription factor, partial [uncultured Dubosiella sp.]
MKTILIVEDDEYIGNMIEAALKNEGFATWRAYSGSEALLVFQSRPVDLVVLDLMLPGLSGEDVLSAIRTVPVVVLSAKSDLDHKVELLLQGAVDYMTKPFELKELVARVRVHLRPVDATREQTLGYHDLALVQNEARHDGQTIRLTPIETKILSALMQA